MKKRFLIGLFLGLSLACFAQETELENYRVAMNAFVKFDLAKKEQSEAIKHQKDSLFRNMETAFLAFALHKESHKIEALKPVVKQIGKGLHCHEMLRNYSLKTKENNTNIMVSFHGVYDYALPNFVSIYIQNFNCNKEEFVLYYYKLNGKGTYFVKQIKKNKLVFQSEAFTSNPALLNLHAIDDKHLLLIEDMEDLGQRAFVVKKNKQQWDAILAFKGLGFPKGTNSFSKATKMQFSERRNYLHLAGNSSISSHYGYNRASYVEFDPKSKTISYAKNWEKEKITAVWQSDFFEISDFYLGTYMADEPVPYPDPHFMRD